MTTRITTRAFFDRATWTVTYVVSDNATHAAAVIDPVLDYDFKKSGHTGTRSADEMLAYPQDQGNLLTAVRVRTGRYLLSRRERPARSRGA